MTRGDFARHLDRQFLVADEALTILGWLTDHWCRRHSGALHHHVDAANQMDEFCLTHPTGRYKHSVDWASQEEYGYENTMLDAATALLRYAVEVDAARKAQEKRQS